MWCVEGIYLLVIPMTKIHRLKENKKRKQGVGLSRVHVHVVNIPTNVKASPRDSMHLHLQHLISNVTVYSCTPLRKSDLQSEKSTIEIRISVAANWSFVGASWGFCWCESVKGGRGPVCICKWPHWLTTTHHHRRWEDL